MFMHGVIALLLAIIIWSVPTHATQVYQTSESFIQAALGSQPKPQVIWLEQPVKQQIESILSHSYSPIRLRYWQQQQDTVWILEEIGKESMITVGIHISQRQIARVKVLIYRESRGDEVRHAFFTDQFKTAQLTDDLQLDRHIDGITGATLSVRALTKLSRIALYLHSLVIPVKPAT
jgi:uncharacterized protein with FMN-binding domain